MAHQEYLNRVIGIVKGSTWGTAAALSGGKAFAGSVSINSEEQRDTAGDTSTGGFSEQFVKTLDNVTEVTVSCDANFGACEHLIAMMYGTATASPAEVTVGQSDYLHDFDLNVTTPTSFATLGFTTETDQAIEIPSWQPESMEFSAEANRIPQLSFSGPASNVASTTVSTVNSAATIAALALPNTYERAQYAGTRSYFRLNAQAGAALDNTYDLEIMSMQFTLAKALKRQRTTRGANTKNIIQPRLSASQKIIGMLTIKLAVIDDSVLDLLAAWLNVTEYKAETFYDGTLIGSTVRRSHKWQWPRLLPAGPIPTMHDPQKGQDSTPSLSFMVLAAASAPTGMTGVTVPRCEVISARSTTYL